MQWERAEVTAPCLVCGLAIQAGERIFQPVEGQQSGSGLTHLSCAKARLPSSAQPASPQAPVCKHWRTRGFCLFGQRCVFRHPPQCLEGRDQQRQAQGAAELGSEGGIGTAKRPGNQAGKRRSQPRNKFRAGAFRRFLLDTFGREKLGEGAGVLDVAGGKGELAFELLNLNGLPATVLEPRSLELQRRVKWLLNGFYSWNVHHARYNDRVWISSTVEQQAQQAQQAHLCSSTEAADNGMQPQQGRQRQGQQQPEVAAEQPGGAQSAPAAGSVHMPDHLRLVITPALAACLVGQASPSSSADEPLRSPPPHWPAAFEQARQEAHHGRWLRPAPPHERAASAAGGERSTEGGDGTHTPVKQEPTEEPPAPKTPEPAPPSLATLAAPPRRRAVAWSIPADSESEQEEAWWYRAAGMGTLGGTSSSNGAAAPASALAAQPQVQPQVQEAQQQQQQQHGQPECSEQQQQQQQQQASQQAQQEPREVEDAAEAWRRLTQCSVVVGMHPDQATEFVVDLAIAHGKPFAVVPCCVFPGDFPRRTLCGRPVTSYDQFCEYLVAKDPQRIQVATLPFEGRNRVLYRLAP